jgi:integrase
VRDDSKGWDLDQTRAFLSAVADDRLFALWSLSLSTGARRGELIALRWDDVNLDLAVIKIARTRGVVAGEIVENSVKTNKTRKVDIDSASVASLRRWRAHQSADRLRAGEAWADSGFLSTDEIGEPLSPAKVSWRFAAIVAKLDIPKITFHGLRHSHCSLALLTTPPHIVAARTGHAVDVLMKTYGHPYKESGQAAAASIGNQLFG